MVITFILTSETCIFISGPMDTSLKYLVSLSVASFYLLMLSSVLCESVVYSAELMSIYLLVIYSAEFNSVLCACFKHWTSCMLPSMYMECLCWLQDHHSPVLMLHNMVRIVYLLVGLRKLCYECSRNSLW